MYVNILAIKHFGLPLAIVRSDVVNLVNVIVRIIIFCDIYRMLLALTYLYSTVKVCTTVDPYREKLAKNALEMENSRIKTPVVVLFFLVCSFFLKTLIINFNMQDGVV